MMHSSGTRISLLDVECKELTYALRQSLKAASPAAAKNVEKVFREEMNDVIDGIRNHGRFDFLKRFISHGSLLPSWEKGFDDTPRALNDEELAGFVNFVSGHMVSKFQGKLGEILARPPLGELLQSLTNEGETPKNGRLVWGSAIRRLPNRSIKNSGSIKKAAGVQGPDGLLVTKERDKKIRVHAVIEIKSMPVSRKALRIQCLNNLKAVARGIAIDGSWYKGSNVCLGPAKRSDARRVIRIFVCPSNWRLSGRFRVSATKDGHRIRMLREKLPAAADKIVRLKKHEWLITQAWSRDALRAAAFNLAHHYMEEVGEALASDPDPDVALRQDMSPAQAGMNDLLHQLHVAIMRQAEVEPDPLRRGKTIELYNVLGFGWALGHNFRGADGGIEIMSFKDLEDWPGGQK